MKKLKFILVLFAAISGISGINAQTADEIIAKHIEAIGGAENWKKVNSIVQTGTMESLGGEITMVKTVVYNTALRQDYIFSGINGYTIITPTEGWSFIPFKGQSAPEAMTADELKESQDELDTQGHFIDYKAKGHTVELLGKEDVDGTECYKLKLSLKSGRMQSVYVSTKNYNLVKKVLVQNVNGMETESEYMYSNFQKLAEGIVMPMKISISLGAGASAEYTITKVDINKPIDASVFKPEK